VELPFATAERPVGALLWASAAAGTATIAGINAINRECAGDVVVISELPRFATRIDFPLLIG